MQPSFDGSPVIVYSVQYYNVSLKFCSAQTEYSHIENGRYIYRIHRSPMCEYMINFILKLKQLPEKYMMNSVLENFTVLQVLFSSWFWFVEKFDTGIQTLLIVEIKLCKLCCHLVYFWWLYFQLFQCFVLSASIKEVMWLSWFVGLIFVRFLKEYFGVIWIWGFFSIFSLPYMDFHKQSLRIEFQP